MQQVLSYSALQTGMAFLPHGLAAMSAAPLGSLLSTRVGVRPTLIGGTTLLGIGLLHLSRILVEGSFVRDLLPGTVITGFGIVLASVASTIAATAGIEDREQGVASGLLNTSQQIGAAMGLATLVAAATTRTEALTPSLGNSSTTERMALTGGFQFALSASIIFAVLGVLVALFVVCEADCQKAKARALQKGMT